MKRHNKFTKFLVQQITITLSLGLLLAASCTRMQSVKQYLSGSKLAYYWASSLYPTFSTLTVVDLCRNGRYSYKKEGFQETGRWDIQQQGNQILLVYASDRGEKRAVPIYLEDDGKVNIGGASFAVERGGAEC